MVSPPATSQKELAGSKSALAGPRSRGKVAPLMSDETPIRPEYELLHDVTCLDLSIVESERTEFHGTST
jgi:hypothetical protein